MLLSPGVRIVFDAAVLIVCDGITFHDPFDRTLTVDDILIGFGRDVRYGDEGVILNRLLSPFVKFPKSLANDLVFWLLSRFILRLGLSLFPARMSENARSCYGGCNDPAGRGIFYLSPHGHFNEVNTVLIHQMRIRECIFFTLVLTSSHT